MGKNFYDFSRIDIAKEYEIKTNLENYLKNNDFNSLVIIYKILEKKLKLVLLNPLFIFTDSVKNQKKYYLAKNVSKLKEKNIVSEFNNYIFFEFVRNKFIEEVVGLNNYTIENINLLTPFWESLNTLGKNKSKQITINDIKIYIDKYETTYEKFLITKFADYYWKFLYKTFTKYYLNDSKAFFKINTLSELADIDEDDSKNIDLIFYKNNLYNDFNVFNYDEEYFNLLKQLLSEKQFKVVYLYLNGFSLKEICNILNIKYGTVKTHFQRSLNKIIKYYNLNKKTCC